MLTRFYTDRKPSLNPVNNACGWALGQLSGEPMPPPGTVELADRNWVLSTPD